MKTLEKLVLIASLGIAIAGCSHKEAVNKEYMSVKYMNLIPALSKPEIVLFSDRIYYDITPKELDSYNRGEATLKGQGKFYFRDNDGTIRLFPNYSLFVSRRGEPSMQRLARRIVHDARTKEEAIHKVIHYVGKNVRFDVNCCDIRAPEILLRGYANCQGIATLTMSILSNINMGTPEKPDTVDCILVKYKNHLSVAVEGKFLNYNHGQFVFDNKTYSIAEPGSPGFIIGLSDIADFSQVNRIEQVQSLIDSAGLYDMRMRKIISPE